ncbi:MAG: endonuclease III [Candidatus Aenigmatarchaeota archaeon]
MKKIDRLLEVLEDKYGNIIKEMISTENDPFKVLIRTVLSQRTRDENTDQAAERLFEVGESPSDILEIKEDKLKNLIRPAGMYNQKAKRIKAISKKIIEDYNGKIPKTRSELMELPGVGYKTADITLMYGHKIPSIAVDTHCKRIPKRIGIADKEDDVEEIKEKLESTTPKNKWYLVNVGIVKFGQEICRPRHPKCGLCPLAKYCNYYQNNK